MTFWEGFDLEQKIDPVFAATQLGNALAILAGKAGVSPADPLTAPMQAAPAQAVDAQAMAQTGATQANGEAVQPFEGEAPITGSFGEARGDHDHAGLDFGVPSGTAILAMAAGTVIEVGGGGGYGNYVLIDHGNGLVTRYAHLTNATVEQGAQVGAGQAIGVSGSTGNSTGPHLHFETILNGSPVDPTPYLAGGQAILGQASPGGASGQAASKPLPIEDIAAIQVTRALQGLTGQPMSQTALETPAPNQAAPAQQQASGQGGDFFGQVLAGIGAPDTPENRRALEAWARAEGMSAEHNNPFATTWDMGGNQEVLNSHGVKSYGDVATGVTATVNTLLNGRYANIIAALRAGTNAAAVGAAIEDSPWGTGGLVTKILAEG